MFYYNIRYQNDFIPCDYYYAILLFVILLSFVLLILFFYHLLFYSIVSEAAILIQLKWLLSFTVFLGRNFCCLLLLVSWIYVFRLLFMSFSFQFFLLSLSFVDVTIVVYCFSWWKFFVVYCCWCRFIPYLGFYLCLLFIFLFIIFLVRWRFVCLIIDVVLKACALFGLARFIYFVVVFYLCRFLDF